MPCISAQHLGHRESTIEAPQIGDPFYPFWPAQTGSQRPGGGAAAAEGRGHAAQNRLVVNLNLTQKQMPPLAGARYRSAILQGRS